ncbi:hypothetical protein [Streptantibioticus silvisoli]|nr:hypothetical protein [Streptantibioticus silvisoli]
MNSAPHLLTEDRPQFERVLDQALRAMSAAPPTTASPRRPSSEQLRAMALAASAAISACAAAEYEVFLRLRDADRAARTRGGVPTAQDSGATGAVPPGVPVPGVANAVSGAGLFAMMAVLTPVLAGVAAVIFLLVGYLLGAMSPAPSIAGSLRTAGWTFLALAGAAILVGTVGMLMTAVRDGSTAIHASDPAAADEVAAARNAWSAALLERGLLPFLTEAAATGTPSGGPPAGSGAPGGSGTRARGTGIGRPKSAGAAGLGGPVDGGAPAGGSRNGSRTSSGFGYSAPGFSSPGGGEPRAAGPRFSSPDFSSPDFSSPDFTGPQGPVPGERDADGERG